nr:hypothetical protein CFP56_42806 [Quercus suber]
MIATNGVKDVGKECPQDLAHDEVQPNLDGEKPILVPPHMRRNMKDATSSQATQASSMTHGDVQLSLIPLEMSIAYPMFSSTRMHQQIQVEKMRSGKYATSSQAPQASSMLYGDVQSSFIPPEMPIVYPMFSSTRMNQEIQVEKMRRSGKDATSSQAPQVSSMIHVTVRTRAIGEGRALWQQENGRGIVYGREFGYERESNV